MTDSGSEGLTFLNLGLSVVDFFIVVCLVFALRYRLRIESVYGIKTERGRIHAVVGTFVLLLYGSLGIITAVGATIRMLEIDGEIFFMVSLIAVGIRVSIFIVLMSWLAFTLDNNIHGRWPRVDRLIERVLNF